MDIGLVVRLGSFVLSFAAFVLAAMANRRKAVDDRFDAASQKVESNRKRIETLDHKVSANAQKIENLPSLKQMHDVELAMRDLTGQLKRYDENLRQRENDIERVEASINRIEDYLYKSGLK